MNNQQLTFYQEYERKIEEYRHILLNLVKLNHEETFKLLEVLHSNGYVVNYDPSTKYGVLEFCIPKMK